MALQLYHDEECTQPINASNPDTVKEPAVIGSNIESERTIYLKSDNQYWTFPVKFIVPPSVEELKAEKIKQVKRHAHNLFSETDWYVIRFQETGKEIPEHILAERQQIRERSDMAEQEILTLSTIEEVKNYVIEKG